MFMNAKPKTLTAFILLSVVLASSALADTIVQPGVNAVGRWEGTNPITDEEGQNEMVAAGNPTYTATTLGGVSITAFEFDGSGDFFKNLTADDLDFNSGGAFAAWIYPDTNGVGQDDMLFSTREGGNTPLKFALNEGKLLYYDQVNAVSVDGTDTIPTGQWTFVVLNVNGTTGKEFWINTTLDKGSTNTDRPAASNSFGIGAYPDGAGNDYDGKMYCVRVFNATLNETQIKTLYNGGLPTCEPLSHPIFSTVVNNATPFTKKGDKVNWSSQISGSLSHCWFSHNNTGTWVNESIFECDSPYNYTESIVVTAPAGSNVCGYFGANNSLGRAVSSTSCFTTNYSSYLTATFDNFKTISGTSYVRELSYNASVINCLKTESVQFTFLVNGVAERSETHSCVAGKNVFFDHVYTHDSEERFNASFRVTSTQGLELNRTANTTFFSDLEDPQMGVAFSEPSGRFNSSTINVTYWCYDSVFPSLNYSSVVFNGASFFNNTGLANNTVLSNATQMGNGENTFFMTCSDAFSEGNLSHTFTGYNAVIFLWDEQDNAVFNASNLSYAYMWYGKNESYYDFTGASEAKVNFSSLNDSQLRVELGYLNGDIIVRYIDLALFDQASQVKICANKDDGKVVNYQQLVISASEKQVAMKNVFTNCYILADQTRFAEENAFMVQAFTINRLYDLYTYDEGVQILLASIDGSIQGYINLDVLEFNQQSYDFSISSDSLSFTKSANTMMRIDYADYRMDNTALSVTLERLDTHETLLQRSTFDSYNNFTLYFDWASLYNVTNTTLFEIQVVATNSDGTTTTLKRYFNTLTSTGVLGSPFAAILAFVLVFFGVTLISSNATFGWFGIVIMIGGLVVLQLAVETWYITFLTAIIAVAGVFITLIAMKKNVMGLFT